MAFRPYSLPFTPVLRVEVLCLQEIVIYLHVTCRLLSLYMWFTVAIELFFLWFIASSFICNKRAVACSKHAICRAAQSQIFKNKYFHYLWHASFFSEWIQGIWFHSGKVTLKTSSEMSILMSTSLLT